MKTLKVKTDANGMKYTVYEEEEKRQKPLSDDEIIEILRKQFGIKTSNPSMFRKFTREVEKLHGIS